MSHIHFFAFLILLPHLPVATSYQIVIPCQLNHYPTSYTWLILLLQFIFLTPHQNCSSLWLILLVHRFIILFPHPPALSSHHDLIIMPHLSEFSCIILLPHPSTSSSFLNLKPHPPSSFSRLILLPYPPTLSSELILLSHSLASSSHRILL